MNKPKATSKKKWLICLVIVLFASTFGIAGLWLIASLVETSSLSFVDDLAGYSLSPIEGNVEMVDEDAYYPRLQPLGDYYRAVFPEHIPIGGARFFFFAETVKPRRNYFDRWEIYLCCEWDEDEYAIQTSRLKKLGNERNVNRLERNDLFPMPAFVYRYQSGDFLYTLFNASTLTIHYVFLSEIGSIDNVVFDHSLAPTKPWLNW